MRTFSLPHTSLQPAVICMGGVPLISETDPHSAFRLLDLYVDLGGNFIDSANIYGKWLPQGQNSGDRNIGAWFQRSGKRAQMVIATKGAHPHLGSMHTPRMTRDEVLLDLEESLRALQTDVIDLYYLHRDDESTPVGVIVEFLNEFVRMGKIRAFGVSNWHTARISAAQTYAAEHGLQGLSANEPMWSLLRADLSINPDDTLAQMDEEMLAFHTQSQLPAAAYNSQASGFVVKYAARAETPVSERLMRTFGSPQNLARADRALQLARELGVSPSAVVLAAITSQPFPAAAIIGSHTEEQLRDSLSSPDLLLTPEQLRYVETGG